MILHTFAQLLPGTPYNGVFPSGRVPLVHAEPFGAGDKHTHIEPCFLVDASKLNEGQIQAMVCLLFEKWKENPDMTRSVAEEQIRQNFPMSANWFEWVHVEASLFPEFSEEEESYEY